MSETREKAPTWGPVTKVLIIALAILCLTLPALADDDDRRGDRRSSWSDRRSYSDGSSSGWNGGSWGGWSGGWGGSDGGTGGTGGTGGSDGGTGGSGGGGSHAARIASYEGTRTCLQCHQDQAVAMHASIHYQWQGNAVQAQGTGEAWLGKLGGINDFCIYPNINWLGKLTNVSGEKLDGGCAKCHTGLGAPPSNEPTPEQLENVDCLICHSDDYARTVADVGGQWRMVPDEAKMTVDILQAAQNITRPSTQACLRCHTHAGGGDNFKRGDLSTASGNATKELDIHLASRDQGGAGLSCLDCHQTERHQIPGRGSDLRPVESPQQVECAQCHGYTPHGGELDRHTARVDCRTCHIPDFARQVATDMNRDYSAPADVAHSGLYEAHMEFRTAVRPVYAFFGGESQFYAFGSPAEADSDGRVTLSAPIGDVNTPGATIQPFKLHLATQPQDPVTKALLPLKMKIWFETGDVLAAAQAGVEAVGWDWNGLDFAQTKRYMAINHEVAPKDRALNCNSCHNGGDRLDFAALGYTPKTTRNGKRLCASCHEDESGEWSGRELFTKVHDKHVGSDGRFSCNECHNFDRATPPPSVNNLRVVLSPWGEANSGAWRVDGGQWRQSGETVELSAGSHRVEFADVAGLITPEAYTITTPQRRQVEVTGLYWPDTTL